ncbi:MAG: hypothetical protein JWN03_2372 [Nocardia sp.]|nr:hypothetical protein [Nocardia sp.]
MHLLGRATAPARPGAPDTQPVTSIAKCLPDLLRKSPPLRMIRSEGDSMELCRRNYLAADGSNEVLSADTTL